MVKRSRVRGLYVSVNLDGMVFEIVGAPLDVALSQTNATMNLDQRWQRYEKLKIEASVRH